ncbi:MAG: hypothetical protein ACMUIE_10090 [Thermoplasmatota archaeon]
MKVQLAVPIALAMVSLLIAGCLGGGGEDKKGPDMIVFNSGMELAGSQQGLAQAAPEDLYIDVPINLDFDNVIKLTINITVEDGDEGTIADTVGQMELTSGEGGNGTVTINGGRTPLTQMAVVEWDGTEYVGTQWTLHIPVTIEGGEDTWPGPFIWRGIPDQGFRYMLEVSYDYHDTGEGL